MPASDAAPGDDVGDLAPFDRTREALVEVRVAGEDGVGPEACFAGGGVDVVGEAASASVFCVD